jgi:signal transduction histidine kinase
VYIYPSNERNNKAVGFDLYADPIRREAIERAIKTGQAALTRKIKLVQEGNKNIQPGLLMFLPVYAPNSNNTKIVGLVSDVFRTHDLMNALLSRFSELDIEIYDGISLNKKQNIYDSNKIFQCGKKLANSQLSMDTSIVIAGTKWRLFINTNANFDASLDYMQPFIVLLAGLTISTLIFLLLINSIKRRNEIVQQLAVSKVLESKKDEFIGIASHELKTPLTSIKAYIQLLERSDLKDKERIYISKASSQIKKLSGLISDLLDVSKIQAGKLQLNITEFLLSELIDDSIESVEHMYATHQIIKPSDIPVITLTGDKFRLEQAMTNFLVNAIKYSPDKKSVQVNTKVTKYEVTIEVIDEGIGISKSNQEKIFDRFFRAEELLPALSGLGIGLYISNQIIKRHNGFIAVKSELNIGSTFYFTLPRQQNDAF